MRCANEVNILQLRADLVDGLAEGLDRDTRLFDAVQLSVQVRRSDRVRGICGSSNDFMVDDY